MQNAWDQDREFHGFGHKKTYPCVWASTCLVPLSLTSNCPGEIKREKGESKGKRSTGDCEHCQTCTESSLQKEENYQRGIQKHHETSSQQGMYLPILAIIKPQGLRQPVLHYTSEMA